ncbi:NineTeen Complex (NTC) component [Marasmius crinis-equi]|uniref:NineTeen Complex (NTC) component n=1 Tax=Marasmius crinis-equi TaxID=585013 RepID=A0ABR3FU39_9AGAR
MTPAQPKLPLTEEQKMMYASEKLMNFRWISKTLASCSPRVLTGADEAPLHLQTELAEIGQFTELAYSTIPVAFVFEHLPSLVQDDFPFEGYDALQGAMLLADFHGNVANLHGFVAYRRQPKQLIVSIAGTSNTTQSLYDLWATRHRHPSGKGEVHHGFWSLYKGIRSYILDGIRKGFEEQDIAEMVVTGHSMGGALSYLLLLDLLTPNDIISPDLRVTLAAFGSPRVGDPSLVKHWQDLCQEYRNRNGDDSFREYSVKAYNDGVPSLPPLKLGYRHFTSEPLYFVHGRMFHVPPSESEYAFFRVEDPADVSSPPEHPRGGHNYYNGRDQERFLRRMKWLNDALAKSEKDKEWQRRYTKIKNRAPAAIQITAEQLLREAQERQEGQFRAPRQRVEDFEELHEYRGRKRKEFEERIRRTRGSIKEWLQYASWEASQNEFARSRSVYERALDVDPRSVQLWLSYTEMELKSRNVQHARNLFDRAVTLLPRVDQLWYKYVYLEELLQNVPGARQVFERWMQWEPDDKAWQAYIKMEERYGELDRASAVYERWVAIRPEPRVWVKWGKFEEDRQKLEKAREVFQTALEFYGDDEQQIEKAQAVFSAFAKMETRLKEYERARVIYKFALERIPRSKSAGLYASYTKFEKQHGNRTSLESTVLGKRRIQYEEELSHDRRNYDVWFDYARLEEGAYRDVKDEGATADEEEAAAGRVREVYEQAVAQVPPGSEKRHWRRYIFLWLDYALFEEIETKDYDRARQIYQTVVKLVPHKVFTFSKLWLMFAKFEIRRLDLTAARRILGAAIGMCPKEKLFKGYIELEIDLREFDRARTLYEKYLEFDPSNSSAWIKYAELESQLQDFTRTRAIFELGVSQSPLSMPELLWKAYIDFEVEEGEREAARALYDRLISLSGHVKVWISYALFEAEPIPLPRAMREEDEEDEEAEQRMVAGDPAIARQVFERGYKDLKDKGLKSEVSFHDTAEGIYAKPALQRVALLEVWKTFEEENGTPDDVQKVQGMMPVVSKRRKVDQETGQTVEDWDLVFADDERESNPTSFKFLQMAHAWKNAQKGGPTSKPSDTLSSLSSAFTKAKSNEDGSKTIDTSKDDDSDAASSRGGDDDDRMAE